MGNENILQELKNIVNSEFQKYVFQKEHCNSDLIRFRENDNELQLKKVVRKPNESEIKEFLYDTLRELYYRDTKIITKSQYKTVKGQIRKHRNSAINFIAKRITSYNFYEKYYNFCTTEHVYLEGVAKVTFPVPVEMAIIDIDVSASKEEE